ncbi:hypothetical protein B0H63DRAFT_496921 [Podospora didyma]|uniref:HNH nuclease domain-containing protein n=1 Tax=Podospora didyma TaxID=330526 RepID=A0AAE0K960_9PEZI|nr:hypothetical protein B0H63DRAFT_496921 [Podospora didyma]
MEDTPITRANPLASVIYHIVRHLESQSPVGTRRQRDAPYSCPLFVRYTYEYTRSQESRDVFLRTFFQSIRLSLEEDEVDLGNEQVETGLRSALFDFADYLLDNFFLPCMLIGRYSSLDWPHLKKTPKPSPAYHSAIQRAQGAGSLQGSVGTPERVSALRGACLVRDRHRCVISRRFDFDEALERIETHGDGARDDDGVLFSEDTSPMITLEVAHILPHSLTKADPSAQLDPSREAALSILNSFDTGIAYLIEGAEIDRPRNVITLTHFLHQLFSDFRIFFKAVPDQQPHTYHIGTFLPRHLMRDPHLPVTRTLYLADSRATDAPLPRLFAVHYAIAHILHLCAAGDYIDTILRDADEHGVRADGSTELGRLVRLGLEQWTDLTMWYIDEKKAAHRFDGLREYDQSKAANWSYMLEGVELVP